jgi:hypothetical protein
VVQGNVCEVYGDSLYSLCCRDHQEETPVALEAAGQEAAVGDVLQSAVSTAPQFGQCLIQHLCPLRHIWGRGTDLLPPG